MKKVVTGKKLLYQGVMGLVVALFLCLSIGNLDTVFAKTKRVTPKEYYVISRMEGDTAILEKENGEEIVVKRSKLPKKAKEEDVLSYQKGKYRRDIKKTRERKKNIQSYMKHFWKE